jgi:hypothetical protein
MSAHAQDVLDYSWLHDDLEESWIHDRYRYGAACS